MLKGSMVGVQKGEVRRSGKAPGEGTQVGMEGWGFPEVEGDGGMPRRRQ